LAQHYGLPTRLLDWTESVLIAAYFALSFNADDCADGAIWVCAPQEMNGRLTDGRFPMLGYLSGEDDFRRLAKGAFGYGDATRADIVLAAVEQQIDLRMAVQQAGFTIHGSRKPLEEYEAAPAFLQKLTIDAEAKPQIKRDVDLLGINRAILFPDLGSLAQELWSRGVADKKPDSEPDLSSGAD
jgi:hypothetical protein